MVFGRGFESQLHVKLDGNDGPFDGTKTKENNLDSGQVTPKNISKKI